MAWKIKISSAWCSFKDTEEDKGHQCQNSQNETNWRDQGGICEEEFCPFTVKE